MEPIQPTEQHKWLAKLLGEWTYENECSPGPGQPMQKFIGTDSVRTMAGIWYICNGALDGHANHNTIMTLGYDPDKKKYVGTFIGSMMTYQWLYEGEVDASGKVLTLDTIGPDFVTPGKLVPYQDCIEFVTDDHRTLTSKTKDADGKWVQFMTANYYRKK